MRRRPRTNQSTTERESQVAVTTVSDLIPGSEAVSLTAPQTLIAKKDFVIRQHPYERVIRAGDDLMDVPEKYLQNLRTEGVL